MPARFHVIDPSKIEGRQVRLLAILLDERYSVATPLGWDLPRLERGNDTHYIDGGEMT